MKNQSYYEKHWRKLELNELPMIGDAWFPGGCCGGWDPKILDEHDSFDPVGMQDNAIYKNPKKKDSQYCR